MTPKTRWPQTDSDSLYSKQHIKITRAAFRILLKGGKIAVSAYQGGGGQALHAVHYIKMKCSRGDTKSSRGGGANHNIKILAHSLRCSGICLVTVLMRNDLNDMWKSYSLDRHEIHFLRYPGLLFVYEATMEEWTYRISLNRSRTLINSRPRIGRLVALLLNLLTRAPRIGRAHPPIVES